MIRYLHEGKKVLLSTNLPNHFTKRDYSTPRDSLLRIFLRVNFSFFSPTFASSRRRKLRRYYQDDISRNVRCLNDSNEAARGNRKHCFATRQE